MTKSYSEIYLDIVEFLQLDERNNRYVPIFSLGKDLDETKFGLTFLYDSAAEQQRGDFTFDKFYPLEKLVIYLASVVKYELSSYSANSLLTAYTYDYTSTSRCEFHEEEDVTKCAIGICKRFSYLLSDYICQHFSVPLTEKHIPKEKSVGVRGISSSFQKLKLKIFNVLYFELVSLRPLTKRILVFILKPNQLKRA